MKITLEQPTCNTKVIIEHGDDDLNINDVFDKLIIPALVGVGFGQSLVEEYLESGAGK